MLIPTKTDGFRPGSLSLFTRILITIVSIEEIVNNRQVHGDQATRELVPPRCEMIRVTECQDLGYNVTAMPNALGHQTQDEAINAIKLFGNILNTECSTHLRFFICSMLVPMCADDAPKPIGACRAHCLQVKSDCHQHQNYTASIDCNKFPEPPHLCMQQNDIARGRKRDKFNYHRFALHTHVATDFYVTSSEDSVLEHVIFVKKWSAFWSVMCFACTAFTILTWCIDPTRYNYPERPVIFLSICYNLNSLMTIVNATTSDERVCMVNALVMYYTTIASLGWWYAFILAWWLSAARDWSTESLTQNAAPRLHVCVWLGSLAITALVFAAGTIQTNCLYDSICNANVLANVIPLASVYVASLYLIVVTARALMRVRLTLKQNGRSACKLERLMTRLSVLIIFYLILNVVMIACWVHEWRVERVDMRDFHRRHGVVEVVLVKIFINFMMGILASMWVWSNKTVRVWTTLCVARGHKTHAAAGGHHHHYRYAMPVTKI